MILRHITIYYHNIIKPLKTILRSYMDVGIPGILSLIAWCAGASANDAAHVAAEVMRATRAANAGDAGDAAVKDRKDSTSTGGLTSLSAATNSVACVAGQDSAAEDRGRRQVSKT